ncbi:MAG: hypothetical protein ACK559_11120, partial [bacterium]
EAVGQRNPRCAESRGHQRAVTQPCHHGGALTLDLGAQALHLRDYLRERGEGVVARLAGHTVVAVDAVRDPGLDVIEVDTHSPSSRRCSPISQCSFARSRRTRRMTTRAEWRSISAARSSSQSETRRSSRRRPSRTWPIIRS